MAVEKQMNQDNQIVLDTGKFLTLIKEGHWEYVDRVHGTGVALIIGVTTEQTVLLVEQYRIPVHARIIELPAGIIGDEPGCSSVCFDSALVFISDCLVNFGLVLAWNQR
jgi:ADP-ribose pyrophosphatase